MPHRKRLLLIHTGGTLGMLPHDQGGALAPSHYAENVLPFVKGLEAEVDLQGMALCNLDSCDITPAHWDAMAEAVASRLDDFDGFVILHGTDTMAWSATALSFMLENLPKPVVLTGAQRPLAEVRTDARMNIIHSAICATCDIPEVCVYFGTTLLRGCRSTKQSIQDYHAFSSPNLPPLVEVGVDLNFRTPPLRPRGPFRLQRGFDPEVAVLTVFPGLRADALRRVAEAGARGVVLLGFGSGNLPTDGWAEAIDEVTRGGVAVVLGSQCARGRVVADAYAGGAAALDAGALSAGDMTREASVVKLMFLLARCRDAAELRRAWPWGLAGEL